MLKYFSLSYRQGHSNIACCLIEGAFCKHIDKQSTKRNKKNFDDKKVDKMRVKKKTEKK